MPRPQESLGPSCIAHTPPVPFTSGFVAAEHRACPLYQEQELSVPGSCSHLSLKKQIKKEKHRCHKDHTYTALLLWSSPSSCLLLRTCLNVRSFLKAANPWTSGVQNSSLQVWCPSRKTCCGNSTGRTLILTTLDEAHWLPGSPSY